MALNILKQPFIRLSYAQGANTYFTDENLNYYKLVATTASDANFDEVSQTPTDGNVIPNSATVFVTFQDNSTVIVNNLHFYGKPQSGGSTDTIKLITGTLLPSQTSTQDYNIGDVVMAIDYSTNYQLGVCTDVDEVEDSGVATYSYTWSILLPEETTSTEKVLKIVNSLPYADTVKRNEYAVGDVIGLVSTYLDSGRPTFDGFKIYVCTKVDVYQDCGADRNYYTWTEVYTYPQTASTNSSFS